jgi:hypothetical protein
VIIVWPARWGSAESHSCVGAARFGRSDPKRASGTVGYAAGAASKDNEARKTRMPALVSFSHSLALGVVPFSPGRERGFE